MSKMSITKIMLETKDGQAVHLTLAEAKDLYQQLHELFGDKPIMWPQYPIVIERDRLPWAPYQPTWVSAPTSGDPAPAWPVVTCRAGGSGLKAHYTGPEYAPRLTPVGAGDGNTYVVG